MVLLDFQTQVSPKDIDLNFRIVRKRFVGIISVISIAHKAAGVLD